jgi:predicted  nucleic acid-binding Zn-ribbon protein
VQRKPHLLFIAFTWLVCGLYLGCHSGPVFTDDTAYRAIEREADRNSAELAVTGADIAAGVERIDGRAERVESELDSLGAAILDSGLEDAEKSTLLRQVATAQREAGALRDEVGILREDAGRLNNQLAEQREISAALSAEHNKREAAAAAVRTELEGTKEELAKVKGQRNVYLVFLIAVCIGILGYIAFKVCRFLKIIPL